MALLGLLAASLMACSEQKFPGQSVDTTADLRDVPFIQTYNFDFRTGSGPILSSNLEGNLQIISAADLLTLLAAAQDEQRLGLGMISGTVVVNGRPVSDVALKVTDASGQVLAIRMEGRLSGGNLILPDGTLCPADATRLDDICIKGSLYYNSPGGVPDFANNRGTSTAGSFTVFNLPPGEVYLWTARGARGNGRITVFADQVSIGTLRVVPIPVSTVGILGSVVEAENNSIAVSGAQGSLEGLAEPVTATTNSIGIFSMPRVGSNGQYLLKVTQSGHLPSYRIVDTPLTDVTLPSFEVTRTATLYGQAYVSSLASLRGVPIDLNKAMLAGRITAPDSTPQPCAKLTVADKDGRDLEAASEAVIFYPDAGSPAATCAGAGPQTNLSGAYFVYNLSAAASGGELYLSYTAEESGGLAGTFKRSGDAIVGPITAGVLVQDLVNNGADSPFPLIGTVKGDDGLTPVAGATVKVIGVTDPAVTADGSGTYTKAGLVGGRGYVVRVSQSGYVDTYQTVRMGAAQTERDLTAVLQTPALSGLTAQSGHILGTAIDTETGKGAADIRFQVTDLSGNLLGESVSDGVGNFALTHLPAGMVNVRVISPDDSGNHILRVYGNGVHWTDRLVTKAISRTVLFPGTLRDLDDGAVSGAVLSVIGQNQSTTTGGSGFSLALETNGRFIVKGSLSGYHDSYNEHIRTHLFDRSDTQRFNDPYLASRGQTALIVGGTPNPALGLLGGTVLSNDFNPVTCGGCAPLGSPGRATLGFFDGDTRLDLAVIDRVSGTVRLHFGDPASPGRFKALDAAYPVGGDPSAIVSADFNRDGTPDLAVANRSDDTLTVLLADPKGKFDALETDVAGTPTPYFLVDASGEPADRCATAWSDPAASAACTSTVLSAPGGLVSGDFNEDGLPDLAVLSQGTTPGTVHVLLGVGTGAFQRVSTASQATPPDAGNNPTDLMAVDIDLDGRIDLAAINGDSQAVLLRGGGDGTFQILTDDTSGTPVRVVFPVGSSPSALTSGDFNGDGRPDLAVVNEGDGTLNILMGTTNSQQILEPLQDADDQLLCPLGGTSPACTPAGIAPVVLTTGEFNGDGRIDLAAVDRGDDSLVLLLGNGDGTFSLFQRFSLGTSIGTGSSLLIGDLNRDGLFDLTVSAGAIPILLGEEVALDGVSLQASDRDGVPRGTVYYFNDAGTAVDPARQGTSASGRFVIFDLPPGMAQVRAIPPLAAGGIQAAGNQRATVYADGYTHLSLKAVTVAPFTVSVSGRVLDPVGPPNAGVGVGNVHIRLLGTTCAANSLNVSDPFTRGSYTFPALFANSTFLVEMRFTPLTSVPPPPSVC